VLKHLLTSLKSIYEHIPLALRLHKWSIIVTALSVIYMIWITLQAGKLIWVSKVFIGASIGVFSSTILALILPYWIGLAAKLFLRPSDVRPYLKTLFTDVFGNHKRLANFCVGVGLFSVFGTAFSANKSFIDFIIPFQYDELFSNLDFTLFFGHYPHQFFDWLVPYGSVMQVFSLTYQAWLYILFFTIGYASYVLHDRRLGVVYILSVTITCFVGGNIFALLFSSAGPAFIELHGITSYEHAKLLMDENLISSAIVQDTLWELQSRTGFSSISAFPSMHVASTTLMLFLAHRLSKRAAIMAWAYWVLIVLGSFILLWHYFVDALFGVLVAVIAWWIASALTPLDVIKRRDDS